MPEFLELLPPNLALEQLLSLVSVPITSESVPTEQAFGRITAESVRAPYPLPPFTRSTVDGYAVRAADTFGASESLPSYLKIAGEVPMGAPADISLGIGQCALIHTGGMLPVNADAVVMVENTQMARSGEVEVLRAAAVGENVLIAGEDVSAGEEVIPTGAVLRPAEIGGLMGLGITSLHVYREPRVGLISSGDEVIAPEAEMKPGKIRDVNSYSLSALVEQHGGIAVRYGIVPDQLDALRETAWRALEECDMVIITAGSSASARDLTSQAIHSLGKPGVLVHGVNVKPGKPTILAVCNGKPVIGLPGNPVSALVIASIFVAPVLERLKGVTLLKPRGWLTARLTLNLASQAGREDWVPVRLVPTQDGYDAEPVFGKSNLIFTLVRADGLLRIAPSATGLEAGDRVAVYLI
jgi:molybdopterin molybdotransferase